MVIIRNLQRRVRTNIQRLRRDSRFLLTASGIPGAELGILLVGDRRMRALNRRYRGVDMTTDVLSFPLCDSPQAIADGPCAALGDIVINLHAAKSQAAVYGNTFPEEVRRLLVHGFLHLIGYDHERNPAQERKMQRKERELLDALEDMD
jgi:probable rRNA maturation factor